MGPAPHRAMAVSLSHESVCHLMGEHVEHHLIAHVGEEHLRDLDGAGAVLADTDPVRIVVDTEGPVGQPVLIHDVPGEGPEFVCVHGENLQTWERGVKGLIPPRGNTGSAISPGESGEKAIYDAREGEPDFH